MKLLNYSLRTMSIKIVAFLSALLTPVTPSLAQQHDTSQCSIEILSPKPGERVGENSLIKGKARIPSGKYLWVFSRVKGLALWWPQGAGPATVEGGKWEVLVFFGTPRDVGRDFEISAAVLEPAENDTLLKWFKKADESGQYPGMRFPNIVSGCPVPRVTVTKNQ